MQEKKRCFKNNAEHKKIGLKKLKTESYKARSRQYYYKHKLFKKTSKYQTMNEQNTNLTSNGC